MWTRTANAARSAPANLPESYRSLVYSIFGALSMQPAASTPTYPRPGASTSLAAAQRGVYHAWSFWPRTCFSPGLLSVPRLHHSQVSRQPPNVVTSQSGHLIRIVGIRGTTTRNLIPGFHQEENRANHQYTSRMASRSPFEHFAFMNIYPATALEQRIQYTSKPGWHASDPWPLSVSSSHFLATCRAVLDQLTGKDALTANQSKSAQKKSTKFYFPKRCYVPVDTTQNFFYYKTRGRG